MGQRPGTTLIRSLPQILDSNVVAVQFLGAVLCVDAYSVPGSAQYSQDSVRSCQRDTPVSPTRNNCCLAKLHSRLPYGTNRQLRYSAPATSAPTRDCRKARRHRDLDYVIQAAQLPCGNKL